MNRVAPVISIVRDDLSCPETGIAKLRGIRAWALRQKAGTTLCCVDTWRSLNGYCLAVACSEMGINFVIFRPEDPRPEARIIEDKIRSVSGYRLVIIPRTVPGFPMGHVLLDFAKKYLEGTHEHVFLPKGGKLVETMELVYAKAKSILEAEPDSSIVVPVGTGTHLAGILRAGNEFEVPVWGVCGYDRNLPALEKWVQNFASTSTENLQLVNLGFKYSDPLRIRLDFSANVYYETKAWSWLEVNKTKLGEKILFWNIGGNL